MRIAIVAPLIESVPPKWYGGTERVVSYLTEELVRQGEHVTLFASGDSVTRAHLRAMSPRSLRLDPNCRDALAHHTLMLDQVAESAAEFDVIHFHIDYLHYPLSQRLRLPALTTLHGRLDLPDLQPLYRRFDDVPVVSISDAQRAPVPWAHWIGTVHHGLPPDMLAPREHHGAYLAFLGRISPEKRPDRAIRIARDAGVPLKVAAKVDDADKTYFEETIRPLLNGAGVEFIGEIGEHEKEEFLGNALALLFPIDWPEPFGLVMIEALACGTPVIGWRCGSVPEIIREGETGFIVDSEDAAVAAVQNVSRVIDRRACRRSFDERFTVARMARDYLRLYRRISARADRSAPKTRGGYRRSGETGRAFLFPESSSS